MYKEVLQKQKFAVASWLVGVVIATMIMAVLLYPISARLLTLLVFLAMIAALAIYDNLIIKKVTEEELDAIENSRKSANKKSAHKRSNKK